MKNYFRIAKGVLFLLAVFQLASCKDDTAEDDVIASFTFQVDETDYKKVTFTNASQNYATLSWNFGDDSQASSEENPVHIYAAVGEFTVTLTATSSGGVTDSYSANVKIEDPNAELTKLVGETSKTWKLLRDVSGGVYPLEVGPYNRSEIWWAVGRDNDELANRPCMLNDEWTFNRDGSMVFNANGDYWAEGGVFEPANTCASTDAMVGPNGEDLSAWGSGNHTFELTTGTNPTLKVIGLGAFLGLSKVATDVEVKVPQESVTYNLISLYDGTTDTLVVEAEYKFNPEDASPGGYWRFVFVHYDNPNDEPPIPGNQPKAAFTMTIDGKTINCTNTSEFSDSFVWDFGDGTTATSADASHTYANDGFYTVTLTATNALGTNATFQTVFFASEAALTDAILQGNSWKVSISEKSVFVGPAMGSSEWWSVPKKFLTGEGTGADDWSCMVDDEFTFAAGGVYTYETNGSARNDGYFGSPNGCISDDEIAASGNGAAFGSATHSYEFIPATESERAKIILTNGGDMAAFLGFYKGYYGGENSDGANAPNGGNLTNQYEVMGYANSGTKEYLFVTVDLSADHTGGSSWSTILER
jgi:PKD repeat protein